MKTPIRQIILGLMVALTLCAGWQPASIQAADKPGNTNTHFTEIQIRQRISELEAARNTRLSLSPENPVVKLVADPQTWLIGIVMASAMGGTGILFLLLMMWRLNKRNWQPTVMGDWEPETSKPIADRARTVPPAASQAPSAPHQAAGLGQAGKGGNRTNGANPVPAKHGGPIPHGNPWNAIEYVPAILPASAKIVKTADAPPAAPHPTRALPAVATVAAGVTVAAPLATPSRETPLSDAEEALFDLRSAEVAAIEVTDNIPPLEQARYWADFHKPELAIDILEQSCNREEIPNGWVMLLDLYLQTERQAEYEALRLEFKEIYNAKVPCWREARTVPPVKSLKDMPDLMQRINKMLPSNGVVTYLRDFLFDDRDGKREGFEFGVYRDLLALFNRVVSGQPVPACEVLWQRQ